MESTINLLPKQTEAWNLFESDDITELGYGGAAGGGKTRLGCYLCIAIAEKYPGSRGAIGRKELKTLRLTTLSTLFEIFNELGYKKDTDYSYNAQDGIIKFSNGSQVYILDTAYSPQDPEYTRFGSLELTWAWIDESNETPDKAKSILKTRVGRKNRLNNEKVKPFWLETFNPNKGHVFRDYYKPWKEKTLPHYRAFVRALPGDNPYLTEEYIENLRRSDKVTRERLLSGNFEYDDNQLKLMGYDAINDITRNNVGGGVKCVIADIARFGGDKIVIGTFDGLRLYRLGVFTYQGTDATAKKIKDTTFEEGVQMDNVLIDEDGIGGGVVDALRGVKGFVGNSRPFELNKSSFGHNIKPSNFSNLRSQCYFKLSDYVNEHKISINIIKFETNIPGYTLETAISDIIEELDVIQRKDNSVEDYKLAIIPKDDMKEILGRSPDFADMLMMRMWFEFKEPTQSQVRAIQFRGMAHRNRGENAW